MNPLMIKTLIKFGIKVTNQLLENLPDLLSEINETLDKQYNYKSPHTALLFNFPLGFKEVRSEVIGSRSFVLEIGKKRKRFYRIRERKNLFPMRYYVWAECTSEQQAITHWEGFVALIEAQQLVEDRIAQGATRIS